MFYDIKLIKNSFFCIMLESETGNSKRNFKLTFNKLDGINDFKNHYFMKCIE